MEARNKKNRRVKVCYKFWLYKVEKFELYRRKDNRYFRFIVYVGKNYDELYSYLQDGDEEIKIPQENKLKAGSVNYEVAKWLLSNYPGISVKNLSEMNNNNVKAQNYDTVAMLERMYMTGFQHQKRAMKYSRMGSMVC